MKSAISSHSADAAAHPANVQRAPSVRLDRFSYKRAIGVSGAGVEVLDRSVLPRRVALGSAATYAGLSVLAALARFDSVALQLVAPAVFFASGLVAALLLISSGEALAALTWYLLGSAVYFGGGTVFGVLNPDERTSHILSDAAAVSDLERINLLNASSVVIVVAITLWLGQRDSHERARPADLGRVWELFGRSYLAIAIAAGLGVLVQAVVFPGAGNLTARSAVGLTHALTPFFLFVSALFWPKLTASRRILALAIFVAVAALSLLDFSKKSVLSAVLPAIVGTWVRNPSRIRILGGVAIILLAYGLASRVVLDGREHRLYDPSLNSLSERFEIIREISSYDSGRIDGSSSVERGASRFSNMTIQSYLMDEYDHGRAGDSLTDFWVALIPRVVWADKPSVTRFGNELHTRYSSIAQSQSQLAPTYTAEAYWNLGILGVVLVSILLGLECGWATRQLGIAMRGEDPSFFVIGMPLAIMFAFVESWIVATYVGGFVTLACIRLALRLLGRRSARSAA